MRYAPRRHAAFTLLEMLVALSLAALITGTLYMSLHIGLGARKRTNAAVYPARAATTVLEFVHRDLNAALPPTGVLAGAFVGEDDTAPSGSADGDTMTFYALSTPNSGDRIQKVEFALTESDDDSDNVLVRRVTNNLLAPETPDPEEEILSRHVISLNFRYFNGSTWADSWDSGTTDNTLPVAVEVAIQLRVNDDLDEEKSTYSLTRIFMPPCGVASDDTESSDET